MSAEGARKRDIMTETALEWRRKRIMHTNGMAAVHLLHVRSNINRQDILTAG